MSREDGRHEGTAPTAARTHPGQRGWAGIVFILVLFVFAAVLYFGFISPPGSDKEKTARPGAQAPAGAMAPARPPVPLPSGAAPKSGAPENASGAPAPNPAGVEAAKSEMDRAIAKELASQSKEAEFLTAEEHRAERGMIRKEAEHFIVKFDGGKNAVAGQLIGLLLEEAYIKVGADLGYYPSDRVEAVLYSKEQFRDVTKSPQWAGAIFDGRIKIPSGGITEKTPALEKVIFHEYTHAVVHRIANGMAPTWLNEGMAQYEEGKDESPYRDALKGFLMNNRTPLRPLEGSFMGLDNKSAQMAYLVSLSATRYIIGEFGAGAVRRILEGVGNGLSLDNAIQSAVYLSYDDLERSWADSVVKR